VAGSEFSGLLVRMVVSHLKEKGLLDTVLERAGETRDLSVLTDEAARSSYGQVRALLEAAAEALGGLHGLAAIGASANIGESLGSRFLGHLTASHAVASSADVFATLPISSRAANSVGVIEPEQVGPSEFLVRMHFVEGYEPFEASCALTGGIFAAVPRMFGLPLAQVVEERCQCRGAPACEFRVRWREAHDDASRAEFYRLRSRVLEERLGAFQRTVGDLVSAESLETAVDRVLEESAAAVHASGFVLAIEGREGSAGRIFARGLSDEAAAEVAARLADPVQRADPAFLAVAVSSAQRHYGWLSAVDPGSAGYLASERDLLEVYARFTASVLDAATAIEAATAEARATQVLLELARSLAQLGTLDEVADRVAHSMRAVVACDAAMVTIGDVSGPQGRSVGLEGIDPADAAPLLEFRHVTYAQGPVEGMQLYRVSDPANRYSEVMAAVGMGGAASVPIRAGHAVLGHMIAMFRSEKGLEAIARSIESRLVGLAAHSAVAVRNAMLHDELRYRVLHDELTGLPNRSLLLDRIDQAVATARRNGGSPAVLFMDLDGFKDVNDNLGHSAGDRLLVEVARRLSGTLRASDTVARLGGDEFVVLLGAPASEPERVAAKLLDVLREPFEIAGSEHPPVRVSASVGIATGTDADAEELLRRADVALYAAKAGGRDRSQAYEPAMGSATGKEHALLMDCRSALENGELRLVYQPIVELRTLRLTGAEALLRWDHPEHGTIAPGVFVPMMERSGVMQKVGSWVLEQACQQGARWHAAGHRIDVSVNVSAQQLHCGLLDVVRSSLRASGLAPTSLIVELTESALMRDVHGASEVLRVLRDLGVRVAIDDFGTGYSSLAYLRQIPVDCLKIDQSFIAALSESNESSALVHTLLTLGNVLHLDTVAEGVEARGQLEFLQLERCTSAQGFLFAHPLSPADLDALLEQTRPARPAHEGAGAGTPGAADPGWLPRGGPSG